VKTPRFIRTSSFRLAALYAGLFAASTGVLFGIVYWTTTDALREQVRLSLRNEMTTFEAKLATGQVSELQDEIEQRLASGKPQTFYYGLRDSSGRSLAGNLPNLGVFEGWREQPVDDEEHEDDDATDEHSNPVLFALGRRLPGGDYFTIATDASRIDEAQEAITDSFIWATAATLLLGLAGGIVLSQGFLRRVDEINRTTRAIMGGDLADRIRTTGSGDELDQLGRNLNDMLDRLHGLMEGLKQVSNDIAHDLRTPLSRLKQRLEAVRSEANSVEEYREAVDQAVQDADMALSIFGALLRIAQIESGKRRANFSDLDLSELLASLVSTYSAVAEDMGKALVSSIESNIWVRGDHELLTQLFVNLIENGLRHTPSGATVSLSLARRDGRPIAEVADTGPGIPESERTNVFKRFYRLERSRSTPGAGLGLALVAAVADLHSARIELLDNKPGLKVVLQFKNTVPGIRGGPPAWKPH
jgi:signal transduction histidine kinase